MLNSTMDSADVIIFTKRFFGSPLEEIEKNYALAHVLTALIHTFQRIPALLYYKEKQDAVVFLLCGKADISIWCLNLRGIDAHETIKNTFN